MLFFLDTSYMHGGNVGHFLSIKQKVTLKLKENVSLLLRSSLRNFIPLQGRQVKVMFISKIFIYKMFFEKKKYKFVKILLVEFSQSEHTIFKISASSSWLSANEGWHCAVTGPVSKLSADTPVQNLLLQIEHPKPSESHADQPILREKKVINVTFLSRKWPVTKINGGWKPSTHNLFIYFRGSAREISKIYKNLENFN